MKYRLFSKPRQQRLPTWAESIEKKLEVRWHIGITEGGSILIDRISSPFSARVECGGASRKFFADPPRWQSTPTERLEQGKPIIFDENKLANKLWAFTMFILYGSYLKGKWLCWGRGGMGRIGYLARNKLARSAAWSFSRALTVHISSAATVFVIVFVGIIAPSPLFWPIGAAVMRISLWFGLKWLFNIFHNYTTTCELQRVRVDGIERTTNPRFRAQGSWGKQRSTEVLPIDETARIGFCPFFGYWGRFSSKERGKSCPNGQTAMQ